LVFCLAKDTKALNIVDFITCFLRSRSLLLKITVVRCIKRKNCQKHKKSRPKL